MVRARHPLDDWQEDGVSLMLAVREDGQWACYEYCEWVSRQNGKGTLLEARALTGFLLLGEQLILWSAHLYKTAMELFRRVKSLIRALGRRVKPNDDTLWVVPGLVTDEDTGELIDGEILVKVSNTNGDEGFERLDTGARIVFIARSAGGGRGMSGDVNIIDEALFYTPEQHQALLYTLSARPNAQIIYTSSPPLRGDTAEIMYALRERGDPTAERDPEAGPWRQDPALGYRDWGHGGTLERILVDIDDMHVAAAANPAAGTRISWETIQRELRSDRAGYPRERLGIWPRRIGSEGGALDPRAWAAMLDPESRRAGDVALAVDVTPMRDHASIGLYGLRSDGLEHVQLTDYRPGPPDWIPDRLAELREVLGDALIGIALDERNGAHALLPALAEVGITPPDDPEQPRRGDLLVMDTRAAADSTSQWIDAFREGGLRHIGQAPMDAAVRNAKTRHIGDAGQIAWGRRASEVDIGPLQVATGARYCWHAWVDLVSADYDVLASVW